MNIELLQTENRNLDNAEIGKKLAFADDIILTFMPVFCDEIEEKKRLYDSNWQDYQALKTNVETNQHTLKTISIELKKEKLIRSILIEIKKMYDADVLYGNNKRIVVEAVSEIRDLGLDELADKLELLKKVVSKHVPRVVKNN